MDTAEQIKNALIKMIAFDEDRDEATVEEIQERVLSILEEAGFTGVRRELEQAIETDRGY
jgi:hypothetical protein